MNVYFVIVVFLKKWELKFGQIIHLIFYFLLIAIKREAHYSPNCINLIRDFGGGGWEGIKTYEDSERSFLWFFFCFVFLEFTARVNTNQATFYPECRKRICSQERMAHKINSYQILWYEKSLMIIINLKIK